MGGTYIDQLKLTTGHSLEHYVTQYLEYSGSPESLLKRRDGCRTSSCELEEDCGAEMATADRSTCAGSVDQVSSRCGLSMVFRPSGLHSGGPRSKLGMVESGSASQWAIKPSLIGRSLLFVSIPLEHQTETCTYRYPVPCTRQGGWRRAPAQMTRRNWKRSDTSTGGRKDSRCQHSR